MGVKLKYYNLTLITTHTPTEEKDEAAKEEFYILLKKACDTVPNYDMTTILGDFNTKVGKRVLFFIQHVEGTAFTGKQMIMENEQ